METTISTTELIRRRSHVLNRARNRGERFVIERNGEVVATLAPTGGPQGISADELIARIGDLKLPGDEFARDLKGVHAAQGTSGGEKPPLAWGAFLDAYFTWPRADDRFADDLEAVLGDRPLANAPEWPD